MRIWCYLICKQLRSYAHFKSQNKEISQHCIWRVNMDNDKFVEIYWELRKIKLTWVLKTNIIYWGRSVQNKLGIFENNFKIFFILCWWLFSLRVYICTTCMQCPLNLMITDSYEPLCECWQLNLGSLQEHQVFLTLKPSP